MQQAIFRDPGPLSALIYPDDLAFPHVGHDAVVPHVGSVFSVDG